MAEGTTYRNEVRTKMPILDILHDFERESIDPVTARQTEANFYRGAPPQWLNFYLAEQNTDEGRFIKRDGYEKLRREILKEKPGVWLNHKPGSGGTTLAMQLLWDLRKSFRCAVLVDPNLENSLIATAVIDLYAGKSNHKTVLLLVQDGNVNTLQESFEAELSKRKITSYKPVIVLNCVRSDHINAEHSAVVKLFDKLTDNERKKFDKKKEWLERQYTKEDGSPLFPSIIPTEFHGFNIMQNDFSQDYVKRACNVLNTTDCRPPVPNCGLQLTACLCLLNSYVPGSFILKSMFEETMSPFSHLMVSFNHNGSGGQQVLRMAHPMIAEKGIQSLYDAGWERSDIALNLLQKLCTEERTLFLSKFMKALLVQRQKDNTGKPLYFSRLILDMTGNAETGKQSCLLVLKEAVKRFPQIGSYPQTLSRLYYLIYYLLPEDFVNARKWAERAKEIAPHNSFIADTLGQVYKHQLNRKLRVLESNPNTLTEVLDLAKKAFKAFKHGEDLAEKEHENRDGLSQQSTIFNYRPKISYLQVANNLFDHKGVLKSVANQNPEYENLITPLSNEIIERARFINMLLSYSQKTLNEKDPDHVLKDVRKCFKNYTGEDLLGGLGTGSTEDKLRDIHQNWQNDTQEPRLKLKMMVENLKASFYETKGKYFMSRYLLPLLHLESDGTKVRVDGVVRCNKMYTTVRDEEIQLDVDPAQTLAHCGPVTVSFDLGFTIRGPTAYNIKFPEKDEEAIN